MWQIVRDPYHLPRWWPKTQRVEGVSSGGWTSVLVTDKGRAVRADYRVELSKGSERRIWSQELAGTPFERLFREVVFELDLAPADAGTAVALATRQKPKGWAPTSPASRSSSSSLSSRDAGGSRATTSTR